MCVKHKTASASMGKTLQSPLMPMVVALVLVAR